MPQGGYQPPTRPAPVSGPGRLSQRTDGRQAMQQLPDADYGEQATFRADQQAAPMAATPGPQQPTAQPPDLSRVVPMNAPSQRPGEPVTHGAALGPGADESALGLNDNNDQGVQYLRKILPSLELLANSPIAGRAARQFVRRVRASL